MKFIPFFSIFAGNFCDSFSLLRREKYFCSSNDVAPFQQQTMASGDKNNLLRARNFTTFKYLTKNILQFAKFSQTSRRKSKFHHYSSYKTVATQSTFLLFFAKEMDTGKPTLTKNKIKLSLYIRKLRGIGGKVIYD
jgi:hypothetical protein